MNGQPGLLKHINQRKILNAIRINETISRAELARQLELTLPTVSRIVDSLLERNWLSSVGMGDSSGGRPPSLVKINPKASGVIGIDLGREYIRIVYTDLLAEILFSDERSTSEVAKPEDLLQYLRSFMQTHGLSEEKIFGIGIGAPGPLDPINGQLLFREDVSEDWSGVYIVEMIQSELGMDCWLANDADAAALAETWFGRGEDIDSTIFILQDAGIGSGIVLNRSIWSGTRNMAGEISHMVVNLDGDDCFCGKKGCVDTYASIYQIEKKVELSRQRDQYEAFSTIIQHAKAKKEPDFSVIQKASEYVAAGIINLVQTVDVEAVILGGLCCLQSILFWQKK